MMMVSNFSTVISYEVLKITTKRQYTDFFFMRDFKNKPGIFADGIFFTKKKFSSLKVNFELLLIDGSFNQS